MNAVQIVRKSSENTVQLPLADPQYTVSETGAPVGAAAPTGITAIYALPETTPDEVAARPEALLDFHRDRGFKLRDTQRTLPDGAWVNETTNDTDHCRLPSPPLRSLNHR